MEDDFKTVILLIGFIRPKNILRILDICENYSSLPVIVSLDGPRDESDALLIEEAKNYIFLREKFGRVSLNCYSSNKGLSSHIVDAIDFAFERYERVIVLEDDCIPSRSFFRFCLDGLKLYELRKDILYLSGTNLDVDLGIDRQRDCILTQYGQIWGWATWRDRWDMRERKVKIFNLITAKLPIVEKIFWIRNFRRPLWDSVWGFYNLVYNDSYALMPKHNLVANIGFDEFASNYGVSSVRNISYTLQEEYVNVSRCADFNSKVDRKIFNSRYIMLK